MTTKLTRAIATGRRDVALILIEKMRPQFVKQMFEDNFLFQALKSSDTVRKQRGGDLIKQGLRLGSTSNMGWFGRGDTKTPGYSDSLNECQTAWRRAWAAILSLLVDNQEARGEYALIDKMTSDLEDRYDGMMDMLDVACYAGMGYDRGPVDGLQALIADNPCAATVPSQAGGTTTATINGINQNDLEYCFWRNVALDFNGSNDYSDAYYGSLAATVTGVSSGDGYYAGNSLNSPHQITPITDMAWSTPGDWNSTTGAVGKRGAEDHLEDAMEWMVKTCSGGKQNLRPRLIICSKKIHSWFKKTQLQYVNIGYETTSFGFGADVFYEGIPIVWTEHCHAGHMYFINTKFLHMVYDPKYFFAYSKMLDLPGHIMDQAMFLIVMLNLVLSRRNVHGVIYNLDSWTNSTGF